MILIILSNGFYFKVPQTFWILHFWSEWTFNVNFLDIFLFQYEYLCFDNLKLIWNFLVYT